MAKKHLLLATAAFSAFVAGAASAQTSTFTNRGSATDQVDDLQEAIEDDADRDDFTFGNAGREIGSWGSVALRASQSDVSVGNDTAELGLGATYGWYDGLNGSELNLAYAYGETNGVEDKNSLAMSYDYTRDLNPRLFAYAAADVNFDNLATGMAIYKDGLIGGGLGYRVVQDGKTDWAVKAGPGWRYIEFGNGTTASEAAYSLESNYAYAFNDGVLLTNDTTLIGSDSDTRVINDLAVSVSMSEQLALRTSYTSEYGGPDISSMGKVENLLGVSVVYNF